tara:strand:- start:2185 stop:2400 length:216 start_codon:yes stop_codon:yes gene_type:complete
MINMGTCSICKKISASGSDHLDCMEKRRIELEDGAVKEKLTEPSDVEKDPNNLGVEIKAVLEHLTKETKPE